MVSRMEEEKIMRIDVITLFPSMFYGPFGESILKRACDRKLIELNVIDLREYTHDKYRTVDDRPFGGGAGMVMKCEPLFEAVEDLRTDESKVIIMTPQGEKFSQAKAVSLSHETHLIFICGHYEGIDERVHEKLADIELSIGDYILTNGNLSAMVVTDAICRLVPGVLDGEETLSDESFNQGLLEYPHYTRPRDFRGMEVPEVLLSGNHKAIASWRQGQSEIRTEQRRPDLLSGAKNNKMEL